MKATLGPPQPKPIIDDSPLTDDEREAFRIVAKWRKYHETMNYYDCAIHTEMNENRLRAALLSLVRKAFLTRDLGNYEITERGIAEAIKKRNEQSTN